MRPPRRRGRLTQQQQRVELANKNVFHVWRRVCLRVIAELLGWRRHQRELCSSSIFILPHYTLVSRPGPPRHVFLV